MKLMVLYKENANGKNELSNVYSYTYIKEEFTTKESNKLKKKKVKKNKKSA